MKKRLYDTLSGYDREGYLPMHMPGHKRNHQFHMENPYQLDITEITGFDNLHHPQGILKELMDRVTKLYDSDKSYLLVNGSTCGILAAVTSCCRRGQKIVVARNCHKAVYNAIRLLELEPIYLYPEGEGGDLEGLGIAGSISVSQLEQVLQQHPEAACVMITSPTYEGIVSPIGDIAEVVHRNRIPLIVDEAHGAHFQWHEAFPQTALGQGADMVIESLHKTLPAFTQTAVLHARFDYVKQDQLEWSLQTYQSSSPSYLLMAGMDRCFQYLEEQGEQAFDQYVKRLGAFSKQMHTLKKLTLFETPQKEISKIVIDTRGIGIPGKKFADILYEEFRIELEMSCGYYCIAMTSVCDEEESFERLAKALLILDQRYEAVSVAERKRGFRYFWKPLVRDMTSAQVREAFMKGEEDESVPIRDAVGRIAAEDIYLYPPGVPLVVAGERMTQDIVQIILQGAKDGYEVTGVEHRVLQVMKEHFNGC